MTYLRIFSFLAGCALGGLLQPTRLEEIEKRPFSLITGRKSLCLGALDGGAEFGIRGPRSGLRPAKVQAVKDSATKPQDSCGNALASPGGRIEALLEFSHRNLPCPPQVKWRGNVCGR